MTRSGELFCILRGTGPWRGCKRVFVSSALGALVVGLVPSKALPDHAWPTYHWKRTSQPQTINVGDNVSSGWDRFLRGAVSDWSNPEGYKKKVKLRLVAGQTKPRNCKPTPGRIEVCSYEYGETGWVSTAQFWVSGSHITQAVAVMNDSYLSKPPYDMASVHRYLMCHELGHTIGLDHPDEDFYNEDIKPQTCMEYTYTPKGNGHPNAHDYEELTYIYDHLEASAASLNDTEAEPAAVELGASPADWGKPVAFTKQGKPSMFVKSLGAGRRVITRVFWSD